MSNPLEALEAAKLAKLIGSELNLVDKMATDRTNLPANKININEFIQRVSNPNASSGPSSYLTNIPQGFAAPVPEHIIQNMVPEPVPSYIPPAPQVLVTETPKQLPQGIINITQNTPTPKNIINKDEKSILTRSDIDSIRNSLKNIDKTMAAMLVLLKNNNTTKHE
jgi:hypothetical protein